MAFDKKKFKEAMKKGGFTQKHLAEYFNKDIKTINRWLSKNYILKSELVRDLCLAIKSSPNEFDPEWEGAIENKNHARVSARVSSASKNGYWLMAKLYGVSETEIVELAPTLFAMFAAAVFEKGNNDKRKAAARILAEEYGLIPPDHTVMKQQEEYIREEKKEEFIAASKIFGGEIIDENDDYYFGSVNPFYDQLKSFAQSSKIIKEGYSSFGKCPSSHGTAFDIPSINEISGNDYEISEAISLGQIELFSKEFESLKHDPEERTKWMKDRVSEINEGKKKKELERRQELSDGHRKAWANIDARMAALDKERILNKWYISEKLKNVNSKSAFA